MSENTIYISYRPEQSLHIAQPLFNALRSIGYDVFMDIDEGLDEINLRQVAAREHFIMLLTPGAFANRGNDRLRAEFEAAVEHKRNIVVLLTRDFDFEAELDGAEGMITHLPRVPSIRIQPKQINQIKSVLEREYLQKKAVGDTVPTASEDEAIVEEKIEKAREYTQQATIRLNTERMFFQAVVKIRRGNYDEALADLDVVISDNPYNESAYLQRGRVLRKKGRKEAALKDYEQATQLSPKLVAAHIGRGELLLETERFQQARDAFAAAMDLQRESAPAIAGLALSQYALGETDEAFELWSWLLERDTNYSDAAWAGEVFDWDESVVARAADLLAKRGS